ncbi:MAG: hypothetical protein EOO30_11460 [Comamonadaceae bacterium]|nr:MAG: hypothetical protein EOO30_11460 [Comamonadaceae bacterium]
MDPVSLLVTLMMKNPDATAAAANAALAPGVVDVARMQGSLVDLSQGILTCYHRTARFRQTDILGSPWDRQWQYGAEQSAVLRIKFTGVTGTPYEMIVAVMGKGNAVRSAVIAENSIVPYNKRCVLEQWVTSN